MFPPQFSKHVGYHIVAKFVSLLTFLCFSRCERLTTVYILHFPKWKSRISH